MCLQADVIIITKANCATPLTYYQSLLLNLMVFKALLVVIVVVMWSIPKVLARVQGRKPREVFVVAVNAVRRQSMVMASAVARRVRGSSGAAPLASGQAAAGLISEHNGSVLSVGTAGVSANGSSSKHVESCREVQKPKAPLIDDKGNVNWFRVFRVVSMVLFIAYPSMSVKIFRLFRCRPVSDCLWRCTVA